jgi:hypothetical protein
MDGETIQALFHFNEAWKSSSSREAQMSLLDGYQPVQEALKTVSGFQEFCSEGSAFEIFVLKQLAAIGQLSPLAPSKEYFSELAKKLIPIDLFYQELGGIVGYHVQILKFLQGYHHSDWDKVKKFHAPSFIDISEETKMVEELVALGIDHLPRMVEFYPVGGAADRLHLIDEKTNLELPAAKLEYAGRTLLEGLIRDLQAREYLYFQILNVQIETPIVMMTSLEKSNHQHINAILKEASWFGRPSDLFKMMMQPLVPAVDHEGNWCPIAPGKFLVKPGGHGVIWKLARDHGIFEWLQALGKEYILVRQINNPLASLDYGLLAFLGIGAGKEMKFGFSSCPRLLQSAEGVNIILETDDEELILTNIEYCDFKKHGIEDLPIKEGNPYSRFSSNTNILFAHIPSIVEAVGRHPFPGLLINLKKGSYQSEAGEKKEALIARLESTMQNIADTFKSKSLDTMETFVTYNHRHKTIATAKKGFSPDLSPRETPEDCFYVQMQAARELLEQHCGINLPQQRTFQEALAMGPEFVFFYHPALGPLYRLIQAKITGGAWAQGTDVHLEIAHLSMKQVNVQGSLQVRADQIMGHLDETGILRYSDQVGKVKLHEVTIENQGVDWAVSAPFWKNRYVRKESFEIILHGKSEFIAKHVHFRGSHRFEVPDQTRMIVSSVGDQIVVQQEPL